MRISKSISLKKFYTLVALSSPLLNVYGISQRLHTFTLRELSIVLVLFLVACSDFKRYKIQAKIVKLNSVLYLAFLLISMAISLRIDASNVMRVLRYCLLIVFVFWLSPDFFDPSFGFKIYRFVTIVSSLFLLLQVFSANVFHTGIPGYITWLPTRTESMSSIILTRRFYSFFEEPGYFGMYVCGYLLLSLLLQKREVPVTLLIILACLLSTSTTSIVLVAFDLFVYVFFAKGATYQRRGKSNLRLKIAIIVISALAVIVFLQSEQFQTVFLRLTASQSTEKRISGYSSFNKSFMDMPFIDKMFGNCMRFYPISGYLLMPISFGIIGSLFMTCLMCSNVLVTDRIGHVLILLFLVENIGCSEFIGSASTLLVYFPFILAKPGTINIGLRESSVSSSFAGTLAR